MSWYYLHKLHTVGPVNGKEISSRIKDGALSPYDLVSLNLGRWGFAYKFEQLYPLFKNKKLDDLSAKKWVITKVGSKGSRIQLGPYSTSQVKGSINSGQVKYSDLIWCSGMLQWYPISMMELFNESDFYDYIPQPITSKEQKGEKKPYLVYVPELPKIELPPIDADGESLV